MRLGTRNMAADAPAGPLKVSTTRKPITSADLPVSASTEVTSAEKSASAHSYHSPGCASRANRQACAEPIRRTNAVNTRKRGITGAMLPFARARRHVIGHAGASRASLKPAGPRDRATPLQDRAIELRSSRWRVGARRHARASLRQAGLLERSSCRNAVNAQLLCRAHRLL